MSQIVDAYREMYPDVEISTTYMFFDEIQLIEGWEYFVIRLYKHYSRNIYISGSNSTMLGSELKSALRGWPDEQEMMPLSFREYCDFKGIDAEGWLESDQARLRNAFVKYNSGGGFPEVVLEENPFRAVKMLQGYFDTMLLKDLAEHYKLSNVEVLRYFLKRIMANVSKPTSILGIHNDIKSRGLKVSKNDLYEWADFACGIFMFLRVPHYSRSLQNVENSKPKYYCIDNGLRDAVLLPQSNDDGKKLENTVFLQLHRVRTPIDVIYYYQGKNECDFIVQRGSEVVQLIQVTWSLTDDDTRKREIDGLLEAFRLTGCRNLLIVVGEGSREEISADSGVKIDVIPAWQWMLGR